MGSSKNRTKTLRKITNTSGGACWLSMPLSVLLLALEVFRGFPFALGGSNLQAAHPSHQDPSTKSGNNYPPIYRNLPSVFFFFARGRLFNARNRQP